MDFSFICFTFASMKSVGIITINHKRRQVLHLWLSQIQRLRRDTDTFIPACVVSDFEDAALCWSFSVAHVVQPNVPVSLKWNHAMYYMRDVPEVDAVMITGSDDVISTEYYLKTLEQVEKGIDLIGTESAYFYCGQGTDRGKLVKLQGRAMLGIGKTVSKRILDEANWTLWTKPKGWGMDAMAQQEIMKHTPSKAIISDIIVDVKTRENLNSFNVFKRRQEVDSSIFFNILSQEELKILKSL